MKPEPAEEPRKRIPEAFSSALSYCFAKLHFFGHDGWAQTTVVQREMIFGDTSLLVLRIIITIP